MSKFCGNCGTVMDDAAVVCGNCGTPLAETPAQAEKKAKFDASAITGVIDGIKKGDKGALMKGGIAIAVVAVVLILIISLFSGGGEEKIAKKLIKAIDKDKPESIVKLLPKFYFGEVDEDSWREEMDEGDWEDNFEEELDDLKGYMDEAIDSEEFSIKYDIVDTDVYGEDYLEAISENLEAYEDFDDGKLKKAVGMTIEATFKKSGEKHDVDMYVVAVKYGAKWYLYSFNWQGNAVTNDKMAD